MPVARVSPSASAAPPTGYRAIRLLRLAGTLVLSAVGIFFALLLAIRFVVFPLVESRQQQIAALLTDKIGQAVEIDTIETGWDGWNPKFSIRGLRIRDRQDLSSPPRLELP